MDTKAERIRLNEIINELELSFLKKVEGKKLICYGASGIWPDIIRIIAIDDLVEFFVDRDISRWGEKFWGKEIKSPSELRKLDKGEYAVVVLAGAFEEIVKMLKRRGWKNGVNIFNIYQYIHVYKEASFGPINKYLRFLDTVPNGIMNVTSRKGSEKIGIILNAEGLNLETTFIPYLVSLFLILKWRGYNAKLIVDRLHWEGDIELYEGRCAVCDYIRDTVIHKLEKLVPKEDILYINPVHVGEDKELPPEDAQECERIAEYSVRWSKWYNCWNSRFRTDNSIRDDFARIFKRNLLYINSFFDKNHFDTINAITALHKMAGVYCYAAEKRNIRVSSQDGVVGSTIISSNGPASYGDDIPLFLKKMWGTIKNKDEIINRAVHMWRERRNATADLKHMSNDEYIKEYRAKGYDKTVLQPPQKESVPSYDVIIPLNLSNDGAALGVFSIFGSMKEWLKKTLDYVIHKLNGTVLIREHPIGKILPSYLLSTELYSIYPEILEPYKGNSKLRYVKSDEEINLYQYIEQCKVLIPWTSTVGVEAGILGKNVLIHTDVYYQNAAFATRAKTQEKYFENLKSCITQNVFLREDKQLAHEDALKYFYYTMNRILITDFTIVNSNEITWAFESFSELTHAQGVDEIIKIVAEGIPSVYLIEKQHRKIYDT